tara:strand:- start:1872 stop:2249 length:378 start_codon:yes stop_codon:yes gene_type:complete
MKSIFIAASILVALTTTAQAEVPNQIMRDTIGRTCSLLISRDDPSWWMKHGKEGYRPLCKCAIDLALDTGLTEKFLEPSFLKSPRGLDNTGRLVVRDRTIQCSKKMFGADGPNFKPLKPAHEERW